MHTVKYSKMRKFSYYSTFRPLNLHSDYDILILLEYRTEMVTVLSNTRMRRHILCQNTLWH